MLPGVMAQCTRRISPSTVPSGGVGAMEGRGEGGIEGRGRGRNKTHPTHPRSLARQASPPTAPRWPVRWARPLRLSSCASAASAFTRVRQHPSRAEGFLSIRWRSLHRRSGAAGAIRRTHGLLLAGIATVARSATGVACQIVTSPYVCPPPAGWSHFSRERADCRKSRSIWSASPLVQ